MTSAPPTTPVPQRPPRPGEPVDPDLRDRYRTDASLQREARRAETVRLTAEAPPSRTPVGPIRVIAGLVTLLLVLIAGASLVGPMLKQTATSERALTAVTSVRFSGGVGDVRVRAAEPGESPKAVATHTWGLWKPKSTVRVSDGVARLTSSCPSRGFATVCSTDWLVVVPAGTDLHLEQGVGSLSVEDVTGDIEATVGVGDMRVAGAESERVSVDLGVGSLRYESVEPPTAVDVKIGVGDVQVRVPDSVGYRVTTSGTAGATNNIGHDPTSERSLRVEAAVGSISIDPS